MRKHGALMAIGAAILALSATAGAEAAVTADSSIATFAGNGTAAFGGDGGPAASALLNEPRDTAVGPDGSIFVADTFNHRVRKIGTDGTITTVAGDGTTAFDGDNQLATEASLYWPHDVTVDSDGVLYIADSNHHRVRRVGLNGIITTVAGRGGSGSTGDGGPAVRARLKNPKSVAIHDGYLYLAGLDNKVRRVNLDTGIISSYAGTGIAGYSGDGGPATAASLNGPQRLQVDSLGNVYVADTGNSAVRRIDAGTGSISTVAGTGVRGFNGNTGAATSIQLDQPRGLALDGDDVLYVADSNNQRIRKVDLVAQMLSTVAGTTRGFAGDGGPARLAKFYQPRGLTVTPEGDLLVADTFNSRLRRIEHVVP
jgi:trimeric autotransporter adhesin